MHGEIGRYAYQSPITDEFLDFRVPCVRFIDVIRFVWRVLTVFRSQDVSIAKRLFALSPSAQQKTPIASSHGVDLILGGHDHLYYISKGVTSWENYDLGQPVLGAEEDEGDILVVKSGNDFRDLSELTLELEPTSPGSVRSHVIAAINGMNCTASLS
jgi:hypothetical protein